MGRVAHGSNNTWTGLRDCPIISGFRLNSVSCHSAEFGRLAHSLPLHLIPLANVLPSAALLGRGPAPYSFFDSRASENNGAQQRSSTCTKEGTIGQECRLPDGRSTVAGRCNPGMLLWLWTSESWLAGLYANKAVAANTRCMPCLCGSPVCHVMP